MLIYVCHFSINCNAFQLINSRKNQSNSALLLYLSTILCIAQQNLSIGVNVVCKGSPSRMRRVLLISLGITIRPRSSTRRTMPVAFIYLSPFTIHLTGGYQPLATGDQRSPLRILTNLFVGANCVRPPTIILQITMLVSAKSRQLYRIT